MASLSVNTSGLKSDAKYNPKSPVEARLARRRLSVIRSSHDAQSIERGIDGNSQVEQHQAHNRRSSVANIENPDNSSGALFKSYAAISKVGYVPFNPHKVNQDRACKLVKFGGDEKKAFFGVFDGHGSLGHDVSEFVSTALPKYFLKMPNLASNPPAAISQAFIRCNRDLVDGTVDCTFSGTTAIVCYLHGRKLYSCNTGDSRAVLGKFVNGKMIAIPLSSDHKPDREDEIKRIHAAKGRVEPCKGTRGEDIGPPRVWLQHQDVPGLAMSRSFGDVIASSVGVVARPEIWYRDLDDDDAFMILASDGVWEFIDSQEAVTLIEKCKSPKEACKVLVDESTKRWKHEEEVIDDTTCMVVYF